MTQRAEACGGCLTPLPEGTYKAAEKAGWQIVRGRTVGLEWDRACCPTCQPSANRYARIVLPR